MAFNPQVCGQQLAAALGVATDAQATAACVATCTVILAHIAATGQITPDVVQGTGLAAPPGGGPVTGAAAGSGLQKILVSGLGGSPLGTGPYGVGTPIAAPVPGGVLFRNPSTGLTLGARAIDPKTKQYIFDSNGRTVGMTKAQQAMVLAFTTDRYSSAVAALGQTFSTIKTIGDGIERQLETLARATAAPVIAAGLVAILDVTVTRAGRNGVKTLVRWIDLETREEEKTVT